PSRNLGARISQGELIFFLDGDDLFNREHIFICLHQMVKDPNLHFVQTGIRIDEAISPYWKNAIANSVPFNICVRRWCHECIGGYPEGEEFLALRCEDAFYRVLLSRYFIGFKIKRETMQHFRYPGNALDRQMEKFSKPPTNEAQNEAMSAQELEAFPAIQKLLTSKNLELKQRLTSWLNQLEQ
ncbi:MAG: glycosyltransferase family A protein, partial [Pseudomonadota bacterium]|nr:glycosyltransferase family A protein [Pseudomonadota bacterium]